MILNPFTGQEVQEETIVMKSILWPDVKELFYEYFSGDKQKALKEMKEAAGSQGMRKESFFSLGLVFKEIYNSPDSIYVSFKTEDEAVVFLNNVYTLHLGIQKIRQEAGGGIG